ncbi:MAG: DUF554 family protein [Verrucomicrobiales bacterium]|jgi:uncharacterized membrane protein YqgA involved in biofilm formation|nr:DUF554 family protein [Verrucomicrobiales bacterium]
MIGTAINAAAVAAGGFIGLSVSRDMSPRHQFFLKTLLGVLALYTGFRMVWMSVGGSLGRVILQVLIALIALAFGSALGRVLGIQRQLSSLGRYANERFSKSRTTRRRDFSEGFVTCSILYCVGPLAIVGPLQEGLQNDPRILLLKAVMDGLASVAFARVFGGGAVLAALPLLAYQGSITLGARALRPWLEHPAVLDGFSSVAGLLVAITSLVILDIKKVPLGDYLPALALAPLLRLLLP